MVLEIVLIAIGLVGFVWAGWKDLKTTEFPDWLPYSMIVGALALRGVFSFWENNFLLLQNSLLVGGIFLGFGLLLYYSKQWGDGDAWLLGAMGFLFADGLGFPAGVLPFPIVMLFTFFFAAFFYIVAYSIVIGARSSETKKFFRSFRGEAKRIVGIVALFSVAIGWLLASASLPFRNVSLLYASPVILFLLLVFLHYGKFIEQNLFRKRIPVSKLRLGDVPMDQKWRVLKKKEVEALKKRGGTIWIKEGVRFSPVFAIAVVIMLVFGDVFSLLAGVL